MRDNQTQSSAALALIPAVQAATVTGGDIDLKDRGSVTLHLITGAISAADGSNKMAVSVLESSVADVATNGTAVAVADLIVDGTRGGALPAVDATADADKVLSRISYIGKKRYIAIKLTETGTFSGIVGCVAVFGHLAKSPA